jgi:AcrR family transcriptional regulator
MPKNKEDLKPKLDLVWTRPEKPTREPALNREQIVRTAIRVADAEGLEAITMRRIAAELDVAPMSLYYHIPTKNDLLDLMMDAAFGEMEFPDQPSGDWRADLRFAAYQARDLGRRHLWLMSLLGERPPLGPNFLHHFEFFLAALDGRGLSIATMADIGNVIDNFVIGFVLSETRLEGMKRHTGMTDAEWNAAIAPHLQRLIATGRYPTVARLIKEVSTTDPDQSFDLGLDCLLDGIAGRITSNI